MFVCFCFVLFVCLFFFSRLYKETYHDGCKTSTCTPLDEIEIRNYHLQKIFLNNNSFEPAKQTTCSKPRLYVERLEEIIISQKFVLCHMT